MLRGMQTTPTQSIGALTMKVSVALYTHRGSLGQGYDNNIAFWNFLAVGNYAGRLYKFAMQEVKRTQDSIHAAIVQDATALEKDLLALQKADEKGEKKKEVVEKLTDFTNTKGEFIMSEWRSLLPRLITT